MVQEKECLLLITGPWFMFKRIIPVIKIVDYPLIVQVAGHQAKAIVFRNGRKSLP